jgi:hypothetical protein
MAAVRYRSSSQVVVTLKVSLASLRCRGFAFMRPLAQTLMLAADFDSTIRRFDPSRPAGLTTGDCVAEKSHKCPPIAGFCEK